MDSRPVSRTLFTPFSLMSSFWPVAWRLPATLCWIACEPASPSASALRGFVRFVSNALRWATMPVGSARRYGALER
jgi:hypothetical protein